jgi:hypothetical protein
MNASTYGTNLRQKASHIAAYLGICNGTPSGEMYQSLKSRKTDYCKKFEVMSHDICK